MLDLTVKLFQFKLLLSIQDCELLLVNVHNWIQHVLMV